MRWTPRLEANLEEILIRNQFDFKHTAKEFQRVLNRDEGTTNIVYKIDSKTLQLRWTDIEIRRYVIPKMQQESRQAASAKSQVDEEEDEQLPPLET